MILKFTKDGFVNGELVFKVGEEYDIDDSKGSASRWIRRGVAFEVQKEETESVIEKKSFRRSKKDNLEEII